jgi:hypothetical protein
MFYGGIRAGRRSRAALAGCALAGLAAVAGCSSGGGQPSWESKLGSGVTVESPGSVAPGNGSPQAVMSGVISALTGGHLTDFCKYEQPSEQSDCNSTMSQVTPSEAASQLPTFKNVQVAYAAIDGTKALIGITGTICDPTAKPKCFTNNDPAAIFDSGKSFSTLWTESESAASNAYSLSPAIEVNGNWYADDSNS